MNNLYEYQNIAKTFQNPNLTRIDIDRILMMIDEGIKLKRKELEDNYNFKEKELNLRMNEINLMGEDAKHVREIEYKREYDNRDVVEREKLKKIEEKRRELLINLLDKDNIDEDLLNSFIKEFAIPKVNEMRGIAWNRSLNDLKRVLQNIDNENLNFLNKDKDIFLPLFNNKEMDKVKLLLEYGYRPYIEDVLYLIKDENLEKEYQSLKKQRWNLYYIRKQLFKNKVKEEDRLKTVEDEKMKCETLKQEIDDLNNEVKKYNKSYFKAFYGIGEIKDKLDEKSEEFKVCDEIDKKHEDIESTLYNIQRNIDIRKNDIIEVEDRLESLTRKLIMML